MKAEKIGESIGLWLRIMVGGICFAKWQHDPWAAMAFVVLLLGLEKP